MVIDTLRTVKRLREVGFTEEQAEALTDLIVHVHCDQAEGPGELPEAQPAATGRYAADLRSTIPQQRHYNPQPGAHHNAAPSIGGRVYPGAMPAAPQPADAGESQGIEARLVKWVIPLMLGQGVLVWGLAQIF